MRIFLTLFTILVTTAICALVWLLQDEHYRQYLIPSSSEIVGERIAKFDLNQVTSVEVTSTEGKTAVFNWKPEKKEWFAKTPWNDRATNIAPLLSFVSNAVIKKSIPLSDAPADTLGFPQNQNKILIKNSTGEVLAHIAIGLASPWHVDHTIEGETDTYPCVYLRNLPDGENAPTYLCNDPLKIIHEYFKNDLVRLRDYAPVNPFKIPDLNKIQIKRNETTMELIKEPDSKQKTPTAILKKWAITKPLKLRADTDEVHKLLNCFVHIKANNIIENKGIDLPKDSTENITLSLFFEGDNAPTIYTIYPTTLKDGVVLAQVSDRPNVLFQLPNNNNTASPITFKNLPTSINDLRSRKLLELEPAEITRILIQQKDKFPIRLKKEKTWNYYNAQNKITPVNEYTLEEFFLSLYKKNILSFISDAPSELTSYGLDSPRIKLYLVDKNNKPQVISIGKPAAITKNEEQVIGFYAKMEGKESVWLINSRVVNYLSLSEHDWLPTAVTDISIASIKNINRVRINKTNQFIDFDFASDRLFVFEGENPNSQDAHDITHKVDGTRASFFIKTLCNLNAIKRIAPQNTEALEQLKKPIMQIGITYQDYESFDMKKLSLNFAPAGNISSASHFYVQNPKSGNIFYLKRKLVEDLYQDLLYQK